jgi:hypothetical protein
MSKSINKNSIVFGSAILSIAVLALGLISLPNIAGATAGYIDNPTPVIDSITKSSAGTEAQTITIKGYGFLPTSVAKVNGADYPTTFIDYSHLMLRLNGNTIYGADSVFITVMNGAPGGGYSNAVELTNNAPLPAPSASSNTSDSYAAPDASAENTNNGDENANTLASNAIFGANSLVPSGLIQWVLFGIVAMLIIIIVRKFLGASDRYHESPLKHA